MTIRDFLYFDKQNEKKMFRDSKKRNVIFVLSIILGVISLFLWNSRCTMDNFNKQETLTCLMVRQMQRVWDCIYRKNYAIGWA